jgi:HK97 family phage major capsid protein
MAKAAKVVYTAPSFTRHGDGLCAEAGKMLAESFQSKGHGKVLQERFGITFKEDVTLSTASGAYTTMLSTTLYSAAIENIKDIMELVFVNEDLKNKGGFGAYQIPRLQPTIAYEVAEGAVVNYFDEGVDAITVTPRKVVAGTAITWEILKRGMNDFVRFVLQNAADAITRKLASDIVNGLSVAAGQSESGGLNYDNVIDAQAKVEAAVWGNGTPYGFLATHLVANTTEFATLSKTTEWKNHVYYANVRPGDEFVVNRPALMFGNMKIVVTPFLTHSKAMVLDNKKAAMLVKESDLETFEGALPGRPYDREVVALMSYVLAVVFPDAICRITT